MIDLATLKVGDKVLVRDATMFPKAALDDDGMLTARLVTLRNDVITINFQNTTFSLHYFKSGNCPGISKADVVEIIPQSVKMTTEEGVALVHELISECMEQYFVPNGVVAENMAEEVVFSHDLHSSQGSQLLLIDLKKKARMVHTDYIENKRTWTFRDKSTVVRCLISNEFNVCDKK